MGGETVWQPSDDVITQSNLHVLMQEQGARTFEQIHAWSVQNPEAFWERTVMKLGIALHKSYTRMLDLSRGIEQAHWLAGAEMNIADSCLKVKTDRKAIITRRQDGNTETLMLSELDRLSNRVTNSLKALGLQKGDTVALYMAMTAEAIALYFGIIKIGGTAISIPESFPPEEIAKRLRIGKAKIVFTQDVLTRGGKQLSVYEKVCKANAPKTIVFSSQQPPLPLRTGDMSWDDFLTDNDVFETVSCFPHDPINILFSSGTTGDPKAIPWDHTSPIKAASDAMYHHDLKPGDVACWPTSMGWMMGPWLVFASLLNHAAIAIYEGGPVERGFCEFVQEAEVTMLGLVPSIVKGWRNTGCAENLDWSCIRTFSSSGEASNAHDYTFLMGLNQPEGVVKPVIEYCGGTEVAGAYIANNLLKVQKPSEFNGKVMGIDFVVLNEQGKACQPGEAGEVYLMPPSIGMSLKLLNADNHKIYYADCPKWGGKILRRHGDRIICLEGGGYQSDGRADNTMNLGGIKVGSAEIERVVNKGEGIIETAAIGIPPKDGGADRLIIFAVPKNKDVSRNTIKIQMQKAIKEHLNPLYHLHDVVFIDSLPRTASNKVMHRELRAKYRIDEAATVS